MARTAGVRFTGAVLPRMAAAVAAGVALTLGACATTSGTQLTAEASSASGSAPATQPTTTATAAPPTTAPATTVAPATTAAATVPRASAPPATTARPAPPSTGTVEVRFTPDPGWSAVAVVDGPSGRRQGDLGAGQATFAGVAPGGYDVTVQLTGAAPPSGGDASLAPAVQLINAGHHEVAPGERLVISCTADGCR